MKFYEYVCPRCGNMNKIKIISNKCFECKHCAFLLTRDNIKKERIWGKISFEIINIILNSIVMISFIITYDYFRYVTNLSKIYSFIFGNIMIVILFIVSSAFQVMLIKRIIKNTC